MFTPSGEGTPEDLPDGVDETKIAQLAENIHQEMQTIGLYADGPIHVHVQPGHLVLGITFVVGDAAFSDRVQNPEQDKFDDSFRMIEKAETKQTAQEIIEEIRKFKEGQ